MKINFEHYLFYSIKLCFFLILNEFYCSLLCFPSDESSLNNASFQFLQLLLKQFRKFNLWSLFIKKRRKKNSQPHMLEWNLLNKTSIVWWFLWKSRCIIMSWRKKNDFTKFSLIQYHALFLLVRWSGKQWVPFKLHSNNFSFHFSFETLLMDVRGNFCLLKFFFPKPLTHWVHYSFYVCNFDNERRWKRNVMWRMRESFVLKNIVKEEFKN